MGRPSLKAERTIEILDAFMVCVARYGLEGSTQDRIAAEAGVKRTILRHFIGNRDEMVSALLEHVSSRFEDMTRDMIDALPALDRSETLVDFLFWDSGHVSTNAAVYQAFVAASDRYPEVGDRLKSFLSSFEDALLSEFSRDYPNADKEECCIVASGVAAIYFSFDASLPLKPSLDWRRRQKLAALRLLHSLR